MNRDQTPSLTPDDRTPPSLAPADSSRRNDQQLAATYIRDQIDSIYDQPQPNATSAAAPQQAQPVTQQHVADPYAKTHNPNNVFEKQPHEHAVNQWQKYHQAWQNYYQQYYQRYYLGQMHVQKQQEALKSAQTPASTPIEVVSPPASASKQLKDDLLEKVKTRAKAAKSSHHFVPITAALTVAFVFLFIQYNQILVAGVKAYVSPGSDFSQSIIIDPGASTKVDPEPRIIVPKISVDAPAVYGLRSLDENTVQNALRDGIVHYPIPGASSLPGQVGNSVFLGHSSNDVFDSGDYKFVFLLLERLEKGDRFYINYQGTRYTYSVTETKVILPNQLNQLMLDTDKPMATLITCVPVGTALKRLIIIGEQVSPSPADAETAPGDDQVAEPESIPGDSPTLFERIFGG